MNISALGYSKENAAITPKIAPEAPTIGVESMFTIFCAFPSNLTGNFPKSPFKISENCKPSTISG